MKEEEEEGGGSSWALVLALSLCRLGFRFFELLKWGPMTPIL